jgi:hypothetical protein
MQRFPKTHLHPIVAKVPDIAADFSTTIVCLPCIFETLTRDFQQLTLLRITFLELALCHGEERSIETGQVFIQEVAMRSLDGVSAVEGAVEARDVVPTGRNGRPGISAVDEEIPERVPIPDPSWETQS